MSFFDIVTPFVRFACIPDDMPVYALHDIPNAQLKFHALVGDKVGQTVRIPYRITGQNKLTNDRNRVVNALLPLLTAQTQTRAFIEKYGVLALGEEKHKPSKAIEEALLQSRTVASTGVFYYSKMVERERTLFNYLSLNLGNGVHFRTFPDMNTYEKDLAMFPHKQLEGICHAFGKQAYCALSHEFFPLARMGHKTFEDAVNKRVKEIFPFLIATGMFHSLALKEG